MRNRSVCLLMLFVFCLTLAVMAGPDKPKDKAVKVDIPAVLKEVQSAVTEAEANHPSGFPDLKSLELSLNTAVEKGGDGKLKFFIFSIGGGGSWEKSSTITLVLERPEKKSVQTQAFKEYSWKAAVAEAIARAQESYLTTRGTFPKLSKRSVEIEIAFTVKGSINGGIDTAELLPVGIELSGKLERTRIHTLKLVYGEE